METLGCGGPGCRQRATFERVSGIATISEYHAFIFLSVCFRLGGRFLFVPVVKRLICVAASWRQAISKIVFSLRCMSL